MDYGYWSKLHAIGEAGHEVMDSRVGYDEAWEDEKHIYIRSDYIHEIMEGVVCLGGMCPGLQSVRDWYASSMAINSYFADWMTYIRIALL